MINYRKASAECREAYFKYLETSSGQSAASFVAGWNAAMASMGFEHDEKICSMEATQFDNAECIHSDKPEKEAEPEHRAGPMPDPGEGYRILSKDPPEELAEGDELLHPRLGGWHESIHARWGYKRQDTDCWYRRKIETDKPAWEPKIGDWVLVTRPENWRECKDPEWVSWMHHCHNKVLRVSRYEKKWGARLVNLDGVDFFFDPNWLSPAETSKDEYREPMLPADAGERCEFSNDGNEWRNGWLDGYLRGYAHSGWRDTNGVCWQHARIKTNP